jgi:hypothetical protein
MFLGHFALGMAAKRVTPRVSLAVLFAAAQLADLIWPILVATGIEVVRIDPGNTAFTPLDFVSYPYSHSLLTLILWAAAFGLAYRAATKRNGVTFVVLAALVTSHWVLDVATHRPDVPVVPGGPRYGLGLWNSIGATLTVELALFAAGVAIYATATRAKDARGRWGFVGLMAFLLLAYFGAAFGPPPPSVAALWITAVIGSVVITAWAWGVDRHRQQT